MNGSSIDLNVSASSPDYVVFWYDDGSVTEIDNLSTSGSYTVKSDWDSSKPSEGEFTLIASNGAAENNATVTVDLDQSAPTVDSKSPEDYATSASPEVSLSASDSPAGMGNVSIRVNGEWSSGTSSASVTPSLSDGNSYTVEYNLTDDVGNEDTSRSWSFDVDTSYEGDSDPELNWSDFEEFFAADSIVKMDGSSDLNMEFDDSDEQANDVTCWDGGTGEEEVDSTTSIIENDGTYEFECEFDSTDDYLEDDEVDLTVEVCDAAGNCQTEDKGTFTFDSSQPAVSLSTVSNATSFNSKFDVIVDVSDETSAENVEYFFDDSTIETGSGTAATLDNGEINIDPADLDSGSHTLYVRAEDQVGRWSTSDSMDFNYYPDKTVEASLFLNQEEFNITAGEQVSFNATTTNNGDIFIQTFSLTASAGDFYSETNDIEELGPSDSETVTFNVATSEEDIGDHTLNVSSSNPSVSQTIDLRIRATQDKKESIESDLGNYSDKYESLKSNISELNNSLSEERKQRLMENTSSFLDNYEKAQKAIDDGRYYEAESALSGLDSEASKATQSFNTIKEEHESAQMMTIFMILGVVIFLALAGGAGFFLYSDEYDIDPEQLIDSDIDIRGFDDLKSRVKTLFKNESEAEEFQWNGFQD